MSRPAADRRIAPYGSWTSKVGAERVAGATLRLGQIGLSGGDICWTEGRPHEEGRNVLVRVSTGGIVRDLTQPPWNVRSRVHEYGGGAFAIGADAVWFCQYDDQRLYRLDASGSATALTRDAAMRYADATLDASQRRLIAVREDHGGRLGEPVNTLVAIEVDTGDERVLAEGHDFFSGPCLSPDGQQIAWGAGDNEIAAAPIDLDAETPKVGEWRVRLKNAKQKIYHVDWSPDSAFLSISRGPEGEGDITKPGTFKAACEMVGIYAPGWNIISVSAERNGTLDLRKAGEGEFSMLTTNGLSNKESAWFIAEPSSK